MNIDRLKVLLPDYTIYAFHGSIHIKLDIFLNVIESKKYILDNIDKIIDVHNSRKMIHEFLTLNNFANIRHYYKYKNITIYVNLTNYEYCSDTEEHDFSSMELIEHMRKILDLESLNKQVIKNI